MRVMLDLDGVVRNFDLAWRKKWKEEFGYLPFSSPRWTYMYHVGAINHGLSKHDVDTLIFYDWGYDIMSGAAPHKHAIDAFYDLSKDHYIVLCTHQFTDFIKHGTLQWLATHMLLPDEIRFSNHKYKVIADVYIEDNATNLLSIKYFHMSELVIGINQPWNRYFKRRLENNGVVMVDSLSDALPIIKEYSNGRENP